MSTESSVRIGIVGLGNIGHHHADRLVDLGATLVGGLDIMADARRRFAEKYDVNTYEEKSELFEAVDAVIITTPNRFHEEYAVAALDAGLDVLLEKPLAHSLESAERIAEAAEEADGFCMVGFNNRFANPVEVVRHHYEEGRLGDVTHVEANYVRRRGIPGRGSWFTSKEVAGGGSLIDIGVHAIDLALYFLDFPEVVEVSGVTRSEFGDRDDYTFVEMWGEDVGPEAFDVDDSASAFIRTDEGTTISLEVAWATNRPTNDEFFLRGTEGGVRFDRASHDLQFYEDGVGGGNHLSTTDVVTQDNDTHKTEQEAFLAAVAEGEHPGRNTVEQGLAVQRVIDAIYRSSETGKAVRLDAAETETETPPAN
ncbi:MULTISPECIES: Gfo/Idh/MocA family protein [Haloferax]|uniref:Putative oxidoreductase YcjS n=1 Tax=Haloferax massiliensis TaxID=1476858 RepID=A0A0D6JNR4_9EURY|nr:MULTISPECIES: Gfo/Idh/MocA family oxidoreductase [Haloferax]MDS0241109.1 Gfo/Idh/MocA family oxidoreductase [Haloferax sp. S2CR25]MDS0444230.1 Gfo/Idh/MocA family oxidoreductase [Haloferax sp. S2CR25-2]CQR49494.1 putative oxidoreductase YcjS [Haloferax massiliensis]